MDKQNSTWKEEKIVWASLIVGMNVTTSGFASGLNLEGHLFSLERTDTRSMNGISLRYTLLKMGIITFDTNRKHGYETIFPGKMKLFWTGETMSPRK